MRKCGIKMMLEIFIAAGIAFGDSGNFFYKKSTTTPKKGGLNSGPKRVQSMNSYLTAEPQRSQRDDLLFCFSLRRRKAKSSHLRSVRFLKSLPYATLLGMRSCSCTFSC